MLKKVIMCAALGVASAADVCRALAMSGGGSKGAFEAGALYGLYHAKPSGQDFDYDVITGVSAGSINLGAMSVFPKEDTENMLQIISDTWSHLTTGDLYQQWNRFTREIAGVVNHSGIYNTEPLYKFITKFFADHGGKVQRRVSVAGVDVNTGTYHIWDETEKDLPKAVTSSASIPFIFPNQQWKEEGLVVMDGGTVYNTNLVSAVQRCREIVDDESKIIIDIVVCSSYSLPEWTDKKSTIGNYLRFQDAKSYSDDMADIVEFKEAFPDVQFRYFVEPTSALAGALKMIDASNSTTYPMQMQGRADGAAVRNAGEGYFFDKMDEYKLSTELKAEFPNVGSYIGSLFKKMGEEREEKENTTKVAQKSQEKNQESESFMQ